MIPKGIRFKNVKPRGVYQEFRDYTVTPVQTYGGTFSINDIVRMQFNIKDWYIDPYESYIECDVQLADETPANITSTTFAPSIVPDNIKFYQMDGPSTSIINDFRLEVNSKEIERIREYDQLGVILTDLNLHPDCVDQKDYECNFSNRGQPTYVVNNNTRGSSINFNSSTPTAYQVLGYNNNVPIFQAQQQTFDVATNQFRNYENQGGIATCMAAGTVSPMIASLSTLENEVPVGYTGTRYLSQPAGLFMSNTAEGNVMNLRNGDLYNPQSYLGQLTVGNSNYGISPEAPYNGANFGNLQCSESPKMSQGNGMNLFLTNLPVTKIVNGNFIPAIESQIANTCQSRATMIIPLLSGVMGILIPQARWQLIPSNSLGNVNMEFRFNPNAFFSHDGSAPAWRVTRFALKLRMYRFDQGLMDQLSAQVKGGIQMHSQNFSLGPLYNIQPNVSVTNNWQLNNGIPSVRALFFWFLANDYEIYNNCRKSFRLSQCITQMQLKIGSTYIPQNPVLGHAGNIVTNTMNLLDNTQFLVQLHAQLNRLFDTQKYTSINKTNFAINNRPYDPSLQTFFGVAAGPYKSAVLKKSGIALWNENRCLGKAIYSFNLEMDKSDDNVMTGIDTTRVRPIELILKSDEGNAFPRGSTMYTMFLSDFIVTFGDGETTTEGQG